MGGLSTAVTFAPSREVVVFMAGATLDKSIQERHSQILVPMNANENVIQTMVHVIGYDD